jgi:hypothetical protein
MNRIRSLTLAAATCAGGIVPIAAALAAQAAPPVIYPAKGQTAHQQEKDKFECHEWAKGQSGYDPVAAAPAPPPTAAPAPAPPPAQAPADPSRGMAGMARGAAGGAAIAELSNHDVGRGAAIGVLGVGARERMKAAQAQQAASQKAAAQQAGAQQAAAQQAAAQQAAGDQKRSTYGRAYSACLEARGYVLK